MPPSTETCRCPKVFRTDWYAANPYSTRDDNLYAGGIIPEILSDVIRRACGSCLEFTETKILFNESASGLDDQNREDWKITEVALNGSFQIVFPVSVAYGRTTHNGYSYVPLLEVPGFVLITAKKSPIVYARIVTSSVFNCWPVIAVFVSMMVLSGIVVWFLVGKLDHLTFKWNTLI